MRAVKILPALAIQQWFEKEKRALPWRVDPTPYRVWVSEVMLQQTQAAVVIAYFERWMRRFPTIEVLALSPLEEVMKMWEGLGYYARARHLHAAAREVMLRYQGRLPDTKKELETLPGLGLYTVGAILSFAFHQKAAAVDGNVLRVLTRYFFIEEDIAESSTRARIQNLTEQLLPQDKPWVVMEGLIELGAKICTKNPRCSECPLQETCQGHLRQRAQQLPFKSKKVHSEVLDRSVALIESEKGLLVRQAPLREVMAGLYEFPYFPGRGFDMSLNRILEIPVRFQEQFPVVKHSFTRYRVSLYPSYWKAEEAFEVKGYRWASVSELDLLPFSAGHRRLLERYRSRIGDAHFAH